MFDTVNVDVSRQWFPFDLADLAELLVFHDRVDICIPKSRWNHLLPPDLDDMVCLSELVRAGRINITFDDFPLGEIASSAGLIKSEFQRHLDELNPDIKIDEEKFTQDVMEFNAIRYEPPSYFVSNSAYDRAWYSMTEHISDSDQGFKYDPKIMLESAQNKLAYLADGDFLQRSFRYYHKQKYGASSESPRVECVEIDRRDEKFQAIHIDSFNGAELLSFLSAVEFMLEERRLSIEIDSYITPELDSLISEMGQQAVGKIDSRKNIELFQRVLFSGATIANGIRSGGNKFSDIMPILEGREPLAAMVRKVPQSQYILTGYIEELQRKEFLEQPVGRVARWITTATTALLVSSALFDKFGELSAAIVTHFGLGAMDTFFLERLIKGETLAKFVNNRLRPFAR